MRKASLEGVEERDKPSTISMAPAVMEASLILHCDVLAACFLLYFQLPFAAAAVAESPDRAKRTL